MSYFDEYRASLRFARASQAATVYRGRVPSLAPGWQVGRLPLGAANDDETPPFPVATTLGQRLEDTAVPGEPLVLCRVLVDGVREAGNVLRLVKTPAGLTVAHRETRRRPRASRPGQVS